MKSFKFILSGAAVVALCVPMAFAQQSGSSSTNTNTNSNSSSTSGTSNSNSTNSTSNSSNSNSPTVQQRKQNQQNRIANGIQSGQLTAGETKNLENKESGINKEEAGMRASDNGKLTSADRTKLNNQQNRTSNQIYQDKHNATTAKYGNNEVGQRRQNQQNRIANGVRNGSLNASQTAKLENKQQGINKSVSGMRQANGGKLTNADKKTANQEQNQASKQIHNAKAN
jgi:hypothetical protein